MEKRPRSPRRGSRDTNRARDRPMDGSRSAYSKSDRNPAFELGRPLATGAGAWQRESQGRKPMMLDLTFIAATVVFVLLAVLYVYACDRLRVKK
jgi:hypothetical protein